MSALIPFRNRLILFFTIIVLAIALYGCDSPDHSSSTSAQSPPHQIASTSENRWVKSQPPHASQRDVHREAIGMPFVANQGQLDNDVAYYTTIDGGTLYVTRDGEFVYALASDLPSNTDDPLTNMRSGDKRETTRWVFREKFVGATLQPSPGDRQPTKANYFLGQDKSHWRSGVDTFNKISFYDIYKGIDLSLKRRGSTVEKVFTLNPGASPEAIRLEMVGQEGLSIEQGELIVDSGLGSLSFTRPVAWQHTGGQKVPITVEWQLLASNQYSFTVGDYDASKPLFIDPLLQATYLGGSQYDFVATYLMDGDKNLYLTGQTWSLDFPGTTAGAQPINGGGESAFGSDIIVAQVSNDLKTLHAATYLGGSGNEYSIGFSPLNPTGGLYISGSTSSADFPGVEGGAQTTFQSGSQYQFDGFVALLSADLSTLIQSTYIGGTGDDYLGVSGYDTQGNIFVSGQTDSSDFPATAEGAIPDYQGSGDSVVALLSPDLHRFIRATYIGGSGRDLGNIIYPSSGDSVLGADNRLYVAGSTNSDDLPGAGGGGQSSYGGGYSDIFIAYLTPDLRTILRSTYFGGSGWDKGLVVRQADGSLLVSGVTSSEDLPGIAGGIQDSYGGPVDTMQNDVFLARINADLTVLEQATYFGGSAMDRLLFLPPSAKDGSLYITGETWSSDLPGTTGGFQEDHKGSTDAFIARISSDLRTLYQATYFGGSDTDQAIGMVLIDTAGDVYFSGVTKSNDIPGTTDGIQTNYGGGASDAMFARFSPDLRTLRQATYLGGNGDDWGSILSALDPKFPTSTLLEDGNAIFVIGGTDSLDFPGTTGGIQENRSGGNAPPDPQIPDDDDIFIAKLSKDLKHEPDVTLECDYAGQTVRIGDTTYLDGVDMTCNAAHLITNGRITTGLGSIVTWEVNTFIMEAGSSIQGNGAFAVKIL